MNARWTYGAALFGSAVFDSGVLTRSGM